MCDIVIETVISRFWLHVMNGARTKQMCTFCKKKRRKLPIPSTSTHTFFLNTSIHISSPFPEWYTQHPKNMGMLHPIFSVLTYTALSFLYVFSFSQLNIHVVCLYTNGQKKGYRQNSLPYKFMQYRNIVFLALVKAMHVVNELDCRLWAEFSEAKVR